MATRIRCLKCMKIIECTPYDTSVVFEHIRTYHPEIILPDDDTMDSKNQEPNSGNDNSTGQRGSTPRVQLPPVDSTMEEEEIRNANRKPMYTRKYKVNSPRVPHSPQKRRQYKTSIEKWRPAKGTIYCPKCGSNKRPIIRSKSEKLSYSTFGAACILTCWPLCFLPCLFPSPVKNYLHCSECNNFLGMYDKQNNCVRPNREYVEAKEKTQEKSTDDEANINPEKEEQSEQLEQPEQPELPKERHSI